MPVTGVEAQIADALLWHTTQLTTTPATQQEHPNVRFTPVAGTPYLRASFLPNIADRSGISFDSYQDHQGLLQVSVFWPSGRGLIQPMQIASQVVAHFPPGTEIIRNGLVVRIDQPGTIAPPLQEPDWIQIPISVRWRCFIPG
jgi:hypothetical protein